VWRQKAAAGSGCGHPRRRGRFCRSGPLRRSTSRTETGTVMLTGSGRGYYNGGEWPELARSLLILLVIITTDNEENGADDNETAEVGSTPKTQFGAGVLDRRGRLNWCGGTKSASGQPPRHPGSGARYGNGFPPRCTVTRCNQALLAAHSTAFSISRRKSSSQKSFWCPSEV